MEESKERNKVYDNIDWGLAKIECYNNLTRNKFKRNRDNAMLPSM